MAVRASKRPLLTPTMVRDARALAGIDQARLAALTGISRKTVSLVEQDRSGRSDARRRAVLERIRTTFEVGFGLKFTFADDGATDLVRKK